MSRRIRRRRCVLYRCRHGRDFGINRPSPELPPECVHESDRPLTNSSVNTSLSISQVGCSSLFTWLADVHRPENKLHCGIRLEMPRFTRRLRASLGEILINTSVRMAEVLTHRRHQNIVSPFGARGLPDPRVGFDYALSVGLRGKIAIGCICPGGGMRSASVITRGRLPAEPKRPVRCGSCGYYEPCRDGAWEFRDSVV